MFFFFGRRTDRRESERETHKKWNWNRNIDPAEICLDLLNGSLGMIGPRKKQFGRFECSIEIDFFVRSKEKHADITQFVRFTRMGLFACGAWKKNDWTPTLPCLRDCMCEQHLPARDSNNSFKSISTHQKMMKKKKREGITVITAILD